MMYGDHLPSLEIKEDENLTYGNKYQMSYFMSGQYWIKEEGRNDQRCMILVVVLNKCNIHTES